MRPDLDAIEAQLRAYCDETERGVKQYDMSDAAIEFDMGFTLYTEHLIAELRQARKVIEAAGELRKPIDRMCAERIRAIDTLRIPRDPCGVCAWCRYDASRVAYEARS